MPMIGHSWHGFSGWGGGSGFTGTITVNIGPSNISAQAGYHMISGSGLHAIGIKKFRRRPQPDGPEQETDFGAWPNWPHTIGSDRVTSVTFGIALGANQEARCHGNIFYWE
jgi:hypothetical protein